MRSVVVVGGGVAGLEASRVLRERGHRVSLLEASDALGGQVRLAAANSRRREIEEIIAWRIRECRHLGAEIKLNVFADAEAVLELNPDVVVLATGGSPRVPELAYGSEFVRDTWDVLSNSLRPKGQVIVYDDNGAYPAMDATERLLKSDAEVTFVTPWRTISPDVGSMNFPPYLETMASNRAVAKVNMRLHGVSRMQDGRLKADFSSDYGGGLTSQLCDLVVAEAGTVPNDDLYWELRDGSVNRGALDYNKLLALQPQRDSSSRGYELYRIGDAVSSRNIHAAVLDAFRLCSAI